MYCGRLFRKYATAFVILVAGGLLTSRLVQLYFSYQETQASLIDLQHEQAASAASRIDSFIADARGQMASVIRPRLAAAGPAPDAGAVRGSGRGGTPNQRVNDYLRLLRQIPAATQIRYIDPAGKEQLRVSRFARNIVASQADLSTDPSFIGAQSGQPYYGQVYLRNETEAFTSLAMLDPGPNAGVNVADLSLKQILDAVTTLQVGTPGYVFVLDSTGRVLADPDPALVVQQVNLSTLPQVRAALDEALSPQAAGGTAIAEDVRGQRILSAHESVTPPGWTVFVEQPLEEAFPPLYATLARTALLLLTGLVLSITTSVILVRRMVTPIHALQAGASRIGAGALNQRIEVHTRDELEALAQDINRMAAQSEESYADLEQKVEVRTRDLALALEAIEVQRQRLEEASQHSRSFWPTCRTSCRTPLNAIIGFSQLLVNRRFGELNDEQAEYLGDILDSGRHLLALINDILDLSKVEAGRMELELEPLMLRDALENALTMVRERASQHSIHLVLEVDPDLGTIDGDMRKINQVIVNLLSNAVKFTPDGGQVEVRARRVDSMVEVSVHDTGMGIRPEDQARIFEEFQQVGSGALSPREGTGLGLALARRFVDLHGGRPWVESEVGVGSTFTFTLPVLQATPPVSVGELEAAPQQPIVTEERSEPMAPRPKGDATRPLILIVEDNRSSADLLRLTLGDEGFAVVVAYDGEEGLDMARRLHPAAIVLDVLLPGWTAGNS